MSSAKGPKGAVEAVANARDSDADVPSPGFDPDPEVNDHVCPACRAQRPPVTTRIDRPWLCSRCGWTPKKGYHPGCVGTLAAVVDEGNGVYSTEIPETIAVAIAAAKAKPTASRSPIEKAFVQVEVVDEAPLKPTTRETRK
jgi:hypothetical protein